MSIKQIPTLKVNSNDLHWLKDQTRSKDTSLLSGINGEAVRVQPGAKKLSTFSTTSAAELQPGGFSEEVKGAAQVTIEKNFTTEDKISSVLYCECGNACDKEASLCKKCQEKQKTIEFSGFLYTPIGFGLKLCWFRLLNKELYCKHSLDEFRL